MRNNSSVQDAVLLERQGAIAHLILNRPDKLNAVNGELCAQLKQWLVDLEQDDAVKVTLLSGNGRSFCVGGDIQAIDRICRSDPEERYAILKKDFSAIEQLYHFRKPTIAAVHGAVIGGGCGIAAACDFVLAEETASFMFPFLDLGILPDMGVLFVVHQRVGLPSARRLLLQGNTLSASEARLLGLVDQVCAQGNLKEASFAVAEKLAAKSSLAMRLTKTHLNAMAQMSFAESLEREVQQQSLVWGLPEVQARMQKILQEFALKKAVISGQ